MFLQEVTVISICLYLLWFVMIRGNLCTKVRGDRMEYIEYWNLDIISYYMFGINLRI